jgi:Flp pilus assembly protein TadB
MNYPQARQPFWHRHPFVTAGALLAALWLVQHGWYVTVAIPVAVVLLVSLRRRRRRAQRQRAAVAARADFEHRLLMAGDPRGVHGRYPPARFAASR